MSAPRLSMIPLQKLFSLGSSFEVIGISSTNTFIIPNLKNVFLEFLSMIESPALTKPSIFNTTVKVVFEPTVLRSRLTPETDTLPTINISENAVELKASTK